MIFIIDQYLYHCLTDLVRNLEKSLSGPLVEGFTKVIDLRLEIMSFGLEERVCKNIGINQIYYIFLISS